MGKAAISQALCLALAAVSAHAQTVAAGARAVVASDTLPVYATMSQSGQIRFMLKRGDPVTIGLVIFGDEVTWCAVSKAGETKRLGYASCEFLEPSTGAAPPAAAAVPADAPPVPGPPSKPITIREVPAPPIAIREVIPAARPPAPQPAPEPVPAVPSVEPTKPAAIREVTPAAIPPAPRPAPEPAPAAPPVEPTKQAAIREVTPAAMPPAPQPAPQPAPAAPPVEPTKRAAIREVIPAAIPPAPQPAPQPAPAAPPVEPKKQAAIREVTPAAMPPAPQPAPQPAPAAPPVEPTKQAAIREVIPAAIPPAHQPAAEPAPAAPPVEPTKQAAIREVTPAAIPPAPQPAPEPAPTAPPVEPAKPAAVREVTPAAIPPAPQPAPEPAPAAPPVVTPGATPHAGGQSDFVEVFLDGSGLRSTLANYTQTTHLLGFLDKSRLAEIDVPALDRVLSEQFQPGAFYVAIGGQIRKNYSMERLSAVTEWLRSSATIQLAALERRALTPEAREELVKFAARLSASPPMQSRLVLIHRIYDALRTADMEVETTIALVHTIAQAIDPALPKEKRYSAVELDRALGSVKSHYRSIMKNARIVHYLFAYQSATDDELENYLTFLESDNGKWLISLVDKGFYDATETISRGLMSEIPRRVKPKRHLPGENTAKGLLP